MNESIDPGAVFLVGFMGLAAIAIVVLNDRLKERAVRRAEDAGRKPRDHWTHHKTYWDEVAGLVLTLILFAVATLISPGQKMSRGVALWSAFFAALLIGTFKLIRAWRKPEGG
jgi:FtsH-binding integral membrane protein